MSLPPIHPDKDSGFAAKRALSPLGSPQAEGDVVQSSPRISASPQGSRRNSFRVHPALSKSEVGIKSGRLSGLVPDPNAEVQLKSSLSGSIRQPVERHRSSGQLMSQDSAGSFNNDHTTVQPSKPNKGGRQLQRSDNIPRGTVVIHKVDAFATKVVESSAAGGAITLFVWLATIAYIVFLILQWRSTPPTKTVGTEWTIGFGPSPMKLTCMAKSGCLISNVLSKANTLGVSDLVTPSQTVCSLLAYNASISADIVFSVDPTEGLSVMWDPATANATSLVGGGLVIISEIRCPGDNDPACVFSLPTPISAGTALLQYVETFNDTAAGPAIHRREWFANMISSDGTVLHASTPCYDPSKPDPKLTGWVQGRLRMNSFYNTVSVTQDSFWLFLFGAVGGAYALFLQMGALILATIGFSMSMRQRWQEKKVQGAELPDDLECPGDASNAFFTQRQRKDLDSVPTSPMVKAGLQPVVSRSTSRTPLV